MALKSLLENNNFKINCETVKVSQIGGLTDRCNELYVTDLFASKIGNITEKTNEMYITDLYADNVGSETNKTNNVYVNDLHVDNITGSGIQTTVNDYAGTLFSSGTGLNPNVWNSINRRLIYDITYLKGSDFEIETVGGDKQIIKYIGKGGTFNMCLALCFVSALTDVSFKFALFNNNLTSTQNVNDIFPQTVICIYNKSTGFSDVMGTTGACNITLPDSTVTPSYLNIGALNTFTSTTLIIVTAINLYINQIY